MHCKGPARAQPSHNSRGCHMNRRISYAFEISLIDYLLPLGLRNGDLKVFEDKFYYSFCIVSVFHVPRMYMLVWK